MPDVRCLLACLVAAVLAIPCHAALNDCGQPVSGGATPTASDALFTLRAATGSETCDPCVCDVDFRGAGSAITASDALRVLRRAVGQAVELTCPACVVTCESSQAPSCGGTCSQSRTCGANPLDPSTCVCLNDCELSEAPTCGGSCAFAQPLVLACRKFTSDDGEPRSACVCLPPDLEVCDDAEAPECTGICQAGSVCGSDGAGGCRCETLPPQGPCEQAAAPACGGTCAPDLICISSSGGCECLDATSHQQTCSGANGPACDGACVAPHACAVDGLGGCDCFEPCFLSEHPACAGECLDAGEVCKAVSANLGGSDLELCECRPP